MLQSITWDFDLKFWYGFNYRLYVINHFIF
jgi:hypothetical protein